MTWAVRLEGGPFDGDFAEVDWRVPVPMLWVEPCANCRDTHWYRAWVKGAERYALDEADLIEMTARYVHADMLDDDHPSIREAEEMACVG